MKIAIVLLSCVLAVALGKLEFEDHNLMQDLCSSKDLSSLSKYKCT